MSKLANQKKRELAERLYIHDGYNAVQICELLDIAPKTMTAWKKGRAGEQTWDERRSFVQSAPSRIRELLYEKIKVESEKDVPDADKLIKWSNTIEKIDKRISVVTVIEVLKQFDLFMNDKNPELGAKLLDWHKQFIHFKATE